jgi:putative membrane protein insertion efficiency factor
MISILSFAFNLYWYGVSPYLNGWCRFSPSCSRYSYAALEKHGIFSGIALTARRIARCHPLGDSGYDPIP